MKDIRYAGVGALMLGLSFAGCGKESAQPLLDARAHEDIGGAVWVDARPALATAKRAVLAAAKTTFEPGRFEKSALLDAEVRVNGRVFEATLRYRVPLAAPGENERVVLSVPGNDGPNPLVRLERLEIGGVPASANGTSSRWEIELGSADAVAELMLYVAGELPSFASRRQQYALEQELDALPALARLVPDVPQIDIGASSGTSDRLSILVLPTLDRPVIHTLTVHAEGMSVLATGLRDGTRFVGAGQGLAVVLVGDDVAGLTSRTAVHGRELTVVAPSGTREDEIDAWVRQIRRSLETLDDHFGPLDASALSVVVSAELDGLGMVSLPGVIVVPSPPRPPEQGGTPTPGAEWSARLDMVLARHPGPREAFERAIATAVARQFWGGWGEGPLSRAIEHGFAAEGALRVVRAAGGDKAGRRALELGWRFPYQLGRMRGAPDPSLLTSELGDPTLARVAQAKAGLAFEALARAIGDEPWRQIGRALIEARRRGAELDEALVRDAFSRHAPRPEQALGLWTRWSTERRGDTDVGELRPEVLLEYLVSDGLVGGLSSALLDNAGELAASPLGQKALAKLSSGESLDAGFGVAMLGELLGPSLDPTSRRWLELGTGLFSKDSRKSALRGLIDELSGELGVPEAERSRLGMLGDLVLDALDAPGGEPPDEAPAP